METDSIRLARDGIKEAVCELRFESRLTPELVIGRLVDASAWAGRETVRLSTADIPNQLRQVDENLRYAPSYQLNAENGHSFVRIGPASVSCHRTAPYPGWDSFGPTVDHTIEALFASVPSAVVSRMGFRFVNGLTAAEHHIGRASDLNILIAAGDQPVTDDFVLVFTKALTSDHTVQLTIATPRYVQGPVVSGFDLLIDVDVMTPVGHYISEAAHAIAWVEEAHRLLKQEFFRLIPAEVIDKLKG